VDIQHLVDRLEDLIDDGRHIFGTKYTLIDEERALEIIDQMRISIPDEIEKAARIIAQRDRILAEAHEEAARIVQQHRDRAEQRINDDEIVRAAQERAKAIREAALQEANRITTEADQYVLQLLTRLEQLLTSNITQVRNGIAVLSEQQAASAVRAEPHQPVHVPRPVDAHNQLVDADVSDHKRYTS
jgi:hypothetical protein